MSSAAPLGWLVPVSLSLSPSLPLSLLWENWSRRSAARRGEREGLGQDRDARTRRATAPTLLHIHARSVRDERGLFGDDWAAPARLRKGRLLQETQRLPVIKHVEQESTSVWDRCVWELFLNYSRERKVPPVAFSLTCAVFLKENSTLELNTDWDALVIHTFFIISIYSLLQDP